MSRLSQGFQTCSAFFWAQTSSRDVKSVWQIIRKIRWGNSLLQMPLTSWCECSCTERGVSCGVVVRLLWELAPPASPVPSCQAEWQSSAGRRSVRGAQLRALDYGRIAELLAAFYLLRVLAKRKTSSWHGKWVRDNHTNSPLTGRVVGWDIFVCKRVNITWHGTQQEPSSSFCSVLLTHCSVKHRWGYWTISLK